MRPGPARRAWRTLAPMIGFTLVLAWLFAWIEINIEGAAGWAANLPTWRIEQHWLLDLFWGSRPMTGYHAFVFPFIFLVFHFPLAFFRRWSAALEMRALACVALFWLVEDFLWFVLNPAYGLARFAPETVAWHKHWIGFAPLEYWIFAPACVALLWRSLPQSGKPRVPRKGLPT